MERLVMLIVLCGCLCLVHHTFAAPSAFESGRSPMDVDALPFQEKEQRELSKSHDRIRRQIDKANGFSLIAIGVFGAFVKYLAYHFISKNSEGGGERSLEDSLLDLTSITSCLSKESPDLSSSFHLHCFFPTFFSKIDSDIISTVIQGSAQKEPADLVLVRGENEEVSNHRRSREISKPEGETEIHHIVGA